MPPYFRGKLAHVSDFPDPSQPPQPITDIERPPGCRNLNPTPPFNVLCSVMDKLRSEKANKRFETLKRLMDLWRIKVGTDLYPLIRLLLPERDRERPVYNLKEAMLAKCYIEILGLDRKGEAAQRLLHWKRPVEGQSETFSGDFARVCYHEIEARSTLQEGNFTVQGINSILDELAKGRLKQNEYVPILRKIYENCTPNEQEWVIRIILKDLRISIREKGVFSCFHPDASTLFNVCSDLKRVCWTLWDPSSRLPKEKANIELFNAFLPQLCHRAPTSSPTAIARLVLGGRDKNFIMEEKLDGERIQLHMRANGAEWRYYSRKAKDYTYLYGAHADTGSLTPYISRAFHPGVKSIVLDGEMMVWDPQLGKYLAFGTLKTAAGDSTSDAMSPRPCFKVFDILFVNGQPTTGKRLSERKKLLRSGRIFSNLEEFRGRIELVEEREGNSGAQITEMLNHILETKGEGVVVKNPDSLYQTNSRGASWIKVKPEYQDQMGENMELLVLGGWWGKGGRTGKLSSLLLGLRVEGEDDGSGRTPHFLTFAKVGSGMSLSDYEWIIKHHKDHWRPFDRRSPPSFMTAGQTGVDDKPDVYIEPENSFVVEVKASEIVKDADGYGAEYTLRFPRCTYVYFDKRSRQESGSYDDDGGDRRERDMWTSLSYEEFKETMLGKPSKRYIDDGVGTSVRKKTKTATKRGPTILQSLQGRKNSDVQAEDSIFRNLTFYVIKGSRLFRKDELEVLILKHGGEYMQAQNKEGTAIVVSDDLKGSKVKLEVKRGHTVVKPDWVIQSIERRRPLPFLKELLVSASDEDKGGRYYDKTLNEFDQVSFVRDRTGQSDEKVAKNSPDSDLPADGDDIKETVSGKPVAPPTASYIAESQKADQMAELWGLSEPASPVFNHQSSGVGSSESENGDTDDEAWFTQQHRQAPSEVDDNDNDDDDPDSFVKVDTPSTSPMVQSLSSTWGTSDGAGLDKTLGQTAMDQDTEANEYDEEKIFNHLVFYIDTPANAIHNRMSSSSPSAEAIERLRHSEYLLREHGGVIVEDIDDPKLTHVIIDDDDSGRYVEITRRTSTPKYRHLVLPDWVVESVNEETLLDEDGFKPK